MRFHHNTTPEETVAYLRDQAINAKQPPAVIDALDALRDIVELPAEVDKLNDQVSDLEKDKDDLRAELSELMEQAQLALDILESIDKAATATPEFYDAADLKAIKRQLEAANSALERHKA